MTDDNAQHSDSHIFRLIIESLTDYAVFTTNTQGIITTWSRGAEKIFLYKPDEIIGQSITLLYTPEDEVHHTAELELGTALREGRAIDERFHAKKGNLKFWASGVVFPLYDDEGKHTGFSKIMQNVSEEDHARANIKEEKSLANTIVTTYPEAIVILNTSLEIVNATPSFIKYFSLVKSDIIGKNLYDVLDGGINVAELRSFIDQTLKSHNFYSNFEVKYNDLQRGARSVIVKPRRIYQPPNLLFSLEFTDQTDNVAMMEEKDVFISVASHEIRTPISVIKAYGQILERELAEAKPIVKRAVLKINEQTAYISSLISALLDTSKITTGKLQLEPEVFNLCELVKEITEAFRVTQTSHEIVIDKQIDTVVSADKLRTGTVITNLISNAIKYSPNAKRIIVDIEATDKTAKVSVKDFGIGIPDNEKHQLFQRFGRTETVKNSKIPGSGLGLHLAAEIIRMQGGEIGFETQEGKGSVFYFTLPLF